MENNEYLVEIYPLAENDLASIFEYYFQESMIKEVAKKITDELKEAILGLSFLLSSHPLIKERRLQKDGIHKLICGDFIILFLINESRKIVSVIRIFHGKMNYQKYL